MNNRDQETDTEMKETTMQTSSLMTPREVAEFLAMPVGTLQTWRAKRTGPRGYRVGKHVRYRREDVEQWLAQRADTGQNT